MPDATYTLEPGLEINISPSNGYVFIHTDGGNEGVASFPLSRVEDLHSILTAYIHRSRNPDA